MGAGLSAAVARASQVTAATCASPRSPNSTSSSRTARSSRTAPRSRCRQVRGRRVAAGCAPGHRQLRCAHPQSAIPSGGLHPPRLRIVANHTSLTSAPLRALSVIAQDRSRDGSAQRARAAIAVVTEPGPNRSRGGVDRGGSQAARTGASRSPGHGGRSASRSPGSASRAESTWTPSSVPPAAARRTCGPVNEP